MEGFLHNAICYLHRRGQGPLATPPRNLAERLVTLRLPRLVDILQKGSRFQGGGSWFQGGGRHREVQVESKSVQRRGRTGPGECPLTPAWAEVLRKGWHVLVPWEQRR